MPTGPRPFLSLISLSLVAAFLFPSIARACKDRMYPATFPVAELHGYAHAYVVRVSRLTNAGTSGQSQYATPFSFEGMVMRTIKGPRRAGEVIRGATTSNEEAYARCPISLEEGKTYLLMLNGSGSTYALPRYGSLYVSADQPEFEGYMADLTKGSQ
ncbi:hypothetical protein PO883_11680 [Massilia sp. DJPM01]|uniref:hypothetical protein n=1 Tax=Massilia sp. DJPM01 TaxID=3024404 RepID=UPI00259DDD31|nr:hypothetical protein [Massilia sp. DJPM01]MDM5177851.1 hypothetical protein [Massilia sp. DJPM01]